MPARPRRRSQPPDTPAYRRILVAAEHCFGVLGFRKASVTEISVSAQVSKPLVYRYFQSKEHLYEVTVARVVDAWNEELVAELADPEGDRSVGDALRGMHRASLAFARRSPLLRGLLARESRMLLAEFSDVVERSKEIWFHQVEQCLERGIETGEIRDDIPVESIADVVTELHLAYAERAVAGRENRHELRASDHAFECLLSGIRARE